MVLAWAAGRYTIMNLHIKIGVALQYIGTNKEGSLPPTTHLDMSMLNLHG
jgi:hypothetical protein